MGDSVTRDMITPPAVELGGESVTTDLKNAKLDDSVCNLRRLEGCGYGGNESSALQ